VLGDNAVTAALAQLARLIRRRRYAVLALWGIVVALLVPQACTVGNHLEAAVRMEGSPAARVDAALAHDFQSRFVHRLVLVLRGLPSPDLPECREALSEIVSAVRAVPGVAGTLSYLDSRDEIFLGREGSFLVVGLDARNVGPEADGPAARGVRAVSARLAGRFPGDAALDGRDPAQPGRPAGVLRARARPASRAADRAPPAARGVRFRGRRAPAGRRGRPRRPLTLGVAALAAARSTSRSSCRTSRR
jgi:hypothetical protein